MFISTKQSIRVIAMFEAAKGGLVLLAGFGRLALIHRDVGRLADELVRHFHLNPASRFPRICVEAAAKSNDTTLVMLACAAFAYAAFRLTEAFGLWHQRRWAEWLGAVSGSVYIPIEMYELMHGVSWPKVMVLSVNLACVFYLVAALRSHGNKRPD